MDVGIGLPNSLHGVQGRDLVAWATRAEDRGFSVLGTIGRIAYPSHEELVVLAAAACATERIALMTTVLVAPPRQAVLLAKQAATLAAVSGGRFRLGLGIGGRADDWEALGAQPAQRGRRLEEAVATCRSIWTGQAPPAALMPVSPAPVDVPVVLGGYSPGAFARAGRLGDAFLAGPMPPEAVAHAYEVVRQGAEEAGRAAPPLYAARYVALGEDVRAEADANAASYYGFGGPETVARIQGGILRSPAEVREALQALAAVRVVETCLWPMSAAPDQVDRLADAALV